MSVDKIFVALFSLVGVIFTYWFFLRKPKERVIEVKNNSINITVEGGYSPNVISLAVGKSTTLNFTRKDPSSCLEEVVLGDFKVRKYLPLNQPTSITITPQKIGEFDYICGMNMFHGKIIVK